MTRMVKKNVIPAKAGIQENGIIGWVWIPACAGMTVAVVTGLQELE
jgi:hypothetical protein